jgi:GcrA cell cycle regulator
MADWTETRLNDLRTLWNHIEASGKKLSTAEIGRRLGITKNSVVGKAHRLHLESRPSPVEFDRNRVKKEPIKRVEEGAVTLPPLASEVVALPEHLLFHKPMILDGEKIPARLPTPRPPKAAKPRPLPAVLLRPFGRVICCLWPIGDPGTPGFHFCDDPSAAGRVYCESHCNIAYIKVQPHRLSSIEHHGPWRSPLTNLVTDFF